MEHMAFNGTRHFPAGEMVEYFQRLGMAFGADTNAHTGFTETVYKIDMPEEKKKLLSDGMTLLELSQLFASHNCICAYNLDGGQTAAMIFKGEVINHPSGGGRRCSDIICFGGK